MRKQIRDVNLVSIIGFIPKHIEKEKDTFVFKLTHSFYQTCRKSLASDLWQGSSNQKILFCSFLTLFKKPPTTPFL